MSDCCSSQSHNAPRNLKCNCPVCQQKSLAVSLKTMLHHLKNVWNVKLEEQQYYFCSHPQCEVVYFSEDNSIIKKENVRTTIGIKEESEEALICYCFGVSKKHAKEKTEIKQFVLQKTRESVCSCESANPSGQCCLKDFARV